MRKAARELSNLGQGGGQVQVGGQICAPDLTVCFRVRGVSMSRWYLVYGTSGSWGKTWGGIITSIINSVQIQILNALYQKVAVALTGTFRHSKGLRCAAYKPRVVRPLSLLPTAEMTKQSLEQERRVLVHPRLFPNARFMHASNQH